jgi:hypothetical protein
MKHPATEQNVRPGFLLAVVGAAVVMVALLWALKGRPAPTEVAVAARTLVRPSASARPVAALARFGQPVATPVTVNSERPRWTGASRLSSPELGADPIESDATTSLAGFPGARTFDYRTQAAQVAEAVRSAIAGQENRGDGMSPGPTDGLAQSQDPSGFTYRAQPAPVGRVPSAMTPPETGGAATSPSAAPQFAGSRGTDNSGPPAQASPVDGSVPDTTAPSDFGGGAMASGSAGRVSPGAGPPGAQAVNNAVEAFREGERLRRAYVEEMRVRRVAMIAEARQQDGM